MTKLTKKVVIGNLKMNGSLHFNEKHFSDIKSGVNDFSDVDIDKMIRHIVFHLLSFSLFNAFQ